MTYPDQPLTDVTAHLEALFLIADANKPDPGRFIDRLTMAAHREDAAAVMLYLATYAAALARRLREHNALPSEAQDFLHDIGALVAATVPRPE